MKPEPAEPNRLLRSMLSGSSSPDQRSQQCLRAIQRALEEYDCGLQVSIVYPGDGSAVPNVLVVANQSHAEK